MSEEPLNSPPLQAGSHHAKRNAVSSSIWSCPATRGRHSGGYQLDPLVSSFPFLGLTRRTSRKSHDRLLFTTLSSNADFARITLLPAAATIGNIPLQIHANAFAAINTPIGEPPRQKAIVSTSAAIVGCVFTYAHKTATPLICSARMPTQPTVLVTVYIDADSTAASETWRAFYSAFAAIQRVCLEIRCNALLIDAAGASRFSGSSSFVIQRLVLRVSIRDSRRSSFRVMGLFGQGVGYRLQHLRRPSGTFGKSPATYN